MCPKTKNTTNLYKIKPGKFSFGRVLLAGVSRCNFEMERTINPIQTGGGEGGF